MADCSVLTVSAEEKIRRRANLPGDNYSVGWARTMFLYELN
jgi:hypothetical protein